MKVADTHEGLYGHYAECVVPGGFIDRLLRSVLSHPKKFQWASYFRSLKRIPKSSPVYGCRSWKKINERRHEVIEQHLGKPKSVKPAEFHALQGVEVRFAGMTVSMFLMSRFHRRLLARIEKQTTKRRPARAEKA